MKLQEAQQKLSPAEYNKLLQSFSLRDLYLKHVECSLHCRDYSEHADLEFKEDCEEPQILADSATILMSYNLMVRSQSTDIFSVRAQFLLQYTMEHSLPEEFFVIFRQYTLPLQVYPYFRELVHSISLRMGLPSLILPLRRIQTGTARTPKDSELPTEAQ